MWSPRNDVIRVADVCVNAILKFVIPFCGFALVHWLCIYPGMLGGTDLRPLGWLCITCASGIGLHGPWGAEYASSWAACLASGTWTFSSRPGPPTSCCATTMPRKRGCGQSEAPQPPARHRGQAAGSAGGVAAPGGQEAAQGYGAWAGGHSAWQPGG